MWADRCIWKLAVTDFYIDLCFIMKLRCYVVIELKACDFEPGFISQLNMYQNVVNDVLRHPDDKPTIGLLLVKGKNGVVGILWPDTRIRWCSFPEWKNQIVKSLREELRSSLPSIEKLKRAGVIVPQAVAQLQPVLNGCNLGFRQENSAFGESETQLQHTTQYCGETGENKKIENLKTRCEYQAYRFPRKIRT